MVRVIFKSVRKNNDIVDKRFGEMFISPKKRIYIALNVRWKVPKAHYSYQKAFKPLMANDCKAVFMFGPYKELVEKGGSVYYRNIAFALKGFDYVGLQR